MAIGPRESKKRRAQAVASALWLMTSSLAVCDFFVVRSMVVRIYGRLFPLETSHDDRGFPLITAVLAIILASVCIAVAVANARLRSKHVGQPSAWKVFDRMLAVELSILVLALFI